MTERNKKEMQLEIKLKHLENDFKITKDEFEKTTSEYLNILKDYERALEELKHKRRHLDSIINTVPDIIYRLDEKGYFTFISEAVNNYGYTPEELIGTSILDIVHPEDRDKAIFKINERRTGERSTKCLEIRLLTKQNEVVPFEVKTTEVKVNQKTFLVDAEGLYSTDDPRPHTFIGTQGIARDIIERKHAEELRRSLERQLFEAQKMESIGRLAGGIAHDFNNILTGIMGYAEMLHMKYLNSDTTEEQATNVIMDGAERAAKLTQQLLGFASGGKYNPEPVNVNSQIKDTVKIIEKILSRSIEIKYDLDPGINSIEVDKNQFDQVLTNIIINSRDAMPGGGELKFRTRNRYIDSEFAELNENFTQGDYVEISVSDTGVGMSNEVKEHIFEPFFTTKGKGKGTGLGLATVYGILKNHDAQIKIDSAAGEGTEIKLYFPKTEKAFPVESAVSDLSSGEATILLVDDEEYIRDISGKLLEKLGYKVILACNGRECINIYSERSSEIDLIMLDLIMPEMAGEETFTRLKEINPDIKVIILSGYTKDGTAKDILKAGGKGFLQKPFRLHEVSEIISKVLSNGKQD
ncbi:response regulator [candidate division KSB1 bacterium]